MSSELGCKGGQGRSPESVAKGGIVLAILLALGVAVGAVIRWLA